ncbi:MAG: hypothetical protein ACI4EV_02120 [Lachnospiraceae bacterium]
MKSVKSIINLNYGRIKQLDTAAKVALKKTMEVIRDEVREEQVIPRDTGALQNEKMFIDDSDNAAGKVRIVHEGPYSRRLYYHPEYHFSKSENPNAKGKWFKDYEAGGSKADFVQKTYKKLYKREAGL